MKPKIVNECPYCQGGELLTTPDKVCRYCNGLGIK